VTLTHKINSPKKKKIKLKKQISLIVLATPNSSLKKMFAQRRGYCKVGRQGLVVPTSLVKHRQ
jgi:hypothetical protein